MRTFLSRLASCRLRHPRTLSAALLGLLCLASVARAEPYFYDSPNHASYSIPDISKPVRGAYLLLWTTGDNDVDSVW
ncbi:MAG: hypothetical protein IPL39_01855 [Opitutaceae bacterium]|nr:hypothetical protein [Opitutaceae bacterium]